MATNNVSQRTSLQPRRTRQPRKLSYLKCDFCRQAKVKCTPGPGLWPEAKCRRCVQRKLGCSVLHRKAPIHAVMAPAASAPSASPEAESFSKDRHNALLLLSLHRLISMAIDEQSILVQEMLHPIKHDPAMHVHAQLHKTLDHDRMLRSLQEEIDSFPNTVVKPIISAMFELAQIVPSFATETFSQDWKRVVNYSDNGDHGMAYLLHMKRLAACSAPPHKDTLLHINLCDDYLFSVHELLKNYAWLSDNQAVWSQLQTQIFTPRAICKIPQVLDEILLNGGDDCLGRSPYRIAYDAGEYHVKWPTDALGDIDTLGRNAWHIASMHSAYALCKSAIDRDHSQASTMALGLTPIHMAAMRGQVQMLETIGLTEFTVGAFLETLSLDTKRNALHWAASCDQIEVVDYLLGMQWSNKISDVIARDYDGDTPLHLAVRFGHKRIVEALLPHIDWVRLNRDPWGYNPFWTAVEFKHLDIMQLLEPFSNIDEAQGTGLTPLAIAARTGFYEGVEYLLAFVHSGRGRVNVNSRNCC